MALTGPQPVADVRDVIDFIQDNFTRTGRERKRQEREIRDLMLQRQRAETQDFLSGLAAMRDAGTPLSLVEPRHTQALTESIPQRTEIERERVGVEGRRVGVEEGRFAREGELMTQLQEELRRLTGGQAETMGGAQWLQTKDQLDLARPGAAFDLLDIFSRFGEESPLPPDQRRNLTMQALADWIPGLADLSEAEGARQAELLAALAEADARKAEEDARRAERPSLTGLGGPLDPTGIMEQLRGMLEGSSLGQRMMQGGSGGRGPAPALEIPASGQLNPESRGDMERRIRTILEEIQRQRPGETGPALERR